MAVPDHAAHEIVASDHAVRPSLGFQCPLPPTSPPIQAPDDLFLYGFYQSNRSGHYLKLDEEVNGFPVYQNQTNKKQFLFFAADESEVLHMLHQDHCMPHAPPRSSSLEGF